MGSDLVPGEVDPGEGTVPINESRETATVSVANTGDRPVQVGSHFHFFEANRALSFDREAAFGMRLDVPAGTAVRFEPGDEREVDLVAYGGKQRVTGHNGLTDGATSDGEAGEALARARERGFADSEDDRRESSERASGETASSVGTESDAMDDGDTEETE